MTGIVPDAEDDLSGDLEIAIEAVAGRERPDGALDLIIKTSRGEATGG